LGHSIRSVMTRTALRKALENAPVGPQGNRLQIALAFTGQRQTAIAEATGLTNGTISQIATGRTRPSLDTASAIARFLGVPVETLFPDNQDRAEVA
jgi:transcriptional regulator with XRE-family HTH domain